MGMLGSCSITSLPLGQGYTAALTHLRNRLYARSTDLISQGFLLSSVPIPRKVSSVPRERIIVWANTAFLPLPSLITLLIVIVTF